MPARDSTSHLLIGKTFNRLTVTGICRVPWKHGTRSGLIWRCSCGVEGQCPKWAVIDGKKKSCGCLKIQSLIERRKTHGQSGKITYKIWASMIQRCMNPYASGFKRYGGRGITVCERWLAFSNFFADMGERPKGLFIERKDNNGNYEPGNCCWATKIAQSRNTRRNRMLTFQGRTQPMCAWADEMKISQSNLENRINQLGWSVEKSLTTPVVPGQKR